MSLMYSPSKYHREEAQWTHQSTCHYMPLFFPVDYLQILFQYIYKNYNFVFHVLHSWSQGQSSTYSFKNVHLMRTKTAPGPLMRFAALYPPVGQAIQDTWSWSSFLAFYCVSQNHSQRPMCVTSLHFKCFQNVIYLAALESIPSCCARSGSLGALKVSIFTPTDNYWPWGWSLARW